MGRHRVGPQLHGTVGAAHRAELEGGGLDHCCSAVSILLGYLINGSEIL